jgi:putative FmdB family regulatory protein
MPIYEYICDNCKYEFEKIQSIKDDSLKKCPKCHKEKLRKAISGGAGLIFKGSGFYITDYKNSKTSETKKHAPVNKSSSEKTQSSKPETKSKEN